MAFGGVATGSMNPQLAASVAEADPRLKDALLRLGREVLRGRGANPPPNRPR